MDFGAECDASARLEVSRGSVWAFQLLMLCYLEFLLIQLVFPARGAAPHCRYLCYSYLIRCPLYIPVHLVLETWLRRRTCLSAPLVPLNIAA